MNKTYDFGWGEPYCVRESLKLYYKRTTLRPLNIDMMGYAPEAGSDLLINLVRQYVKETTDIDYKHIIITNGTTGALNTVLRTFKQTNNSTICYTHKYVFPYYKHIIEKNRYVHREGLYQQNEQQLSQENTIAIVDSPSNPEGDIVLYTDVNNNIIWDSVYHNPVFINRIAVKPDHRVNCGSFSKVFGLTGVRIGYIATNNKEDYDNFKEDNLYENSTISVLGQDLIIDILNNIDLDNFMRSAKYRINNNREMFDRIAYLFDGQAVPEDGMFFAAWATPYTIRLLDKLGMLYVVLDTEGKNKYLRFNLAQTNEITNEAIRIILREDSR